MSKLTDFISAMENNYSDAVIAATCKHIFKLLLEHDAEVRQEQMEADCKAICFACENKEDYGPAFLNGLLWVHHVNVPCRADEIRSAFAKDEQKRKGGRA